jgi:formate hydrogenlyase transcriptional activator
MCTAGQPAIQMDSTLLPTRTFDSGNISFSDMLLYSLKNIGISMAVDPSHKDLIKKLKQLESTSAERLKFEKLLTELSMTFINIPQEAVDEKIETVLRRIGEILEVERTEFIQFVGEEKRLFITHSWTAEGVKRQPKLDAMKLYPWLAEQAMKGIDTIFSSPDSLPEEAALDKKSLMGLGVKSGMIISYTVDDAFICAIAFGSNSHHRHDWPEDYIQRLKLLGEIISNALLRKQADIKLNSAFNEINKLKEQLVNENIYLRETIQPSGAFTQIIGESSEIQLVLKNIKLVAGTDTNVLLLGETGTGKELFAHAIHDLSARNKRAMVIVNCAGLPPTLIESELFGHESGAYTGAMSKRLGRFEIADGSTIFLDEIGELPIELQVKLLRVLEHGQFERLGSSKPISVDVRVIAASNKDLVSAIEEGKFRKDLYYRLNVFPIHIPPLRYRSEDIILIAMDFIKELNAGMGKQVKGISPDDIEALERYPWPGNVRELKNIIERGMITSLSDVLNLDPAGFQSPNKSDNLTLQDLERTHILRVLKKTKWKIKGKDGAAEILGLNPGTLYARMKKLGIRRS